MDINNYANIEIEYDTDMREMYLKCSNGICYDPHNLIDSFYTFKIYTTENMIVKTILEDINAHLRDEHKIGL